MPTDRLENAAAHLTDRYLAPVPSQFMHLPRAMARADQIGEERNYSTFGYIRALADDCLAMTGCIDAPRVAYPHTKG